VEIVRGHDAAGQSRVPEKLSTTRLGSAHGTGAAKLITYLLAGAACGLACDLISLAVALPWLSAGHPRSRDRTKNCGTSRRHRLGRDLRGGRSRAGALAGGQLATIAGVLLYLYVAEPLLTRITAWHAWTANVPGVAAGGLTQATQPGLTFLAPWLGGVVFAG
jgi:ABC-2 type transport system permease protein